MASNALLDRLEADYAQTFAAYDAICTRSVDAGREPTDAEEGQLQDLRSILEPLGERIMQLREDQNRKDAVMSMLTGPTVAEPGGLARIGREEMV